MTRAQMWSRVVLFAIVLYSALALAVGTGMLALIALVDH